MPQRATPTTTAWLTSLLGAAALLACLLASTATAMPAAAASSAQHHHFLQQQQLGLHQKAVKRTNEEALNSVGEGGGFLGGGAVLPGMTPAEAADVLSTLKSDKYRDFIQAYMRLAHKYAAAGGSLDGPNANFRF